MWTYVAKETSVQQKKLWFPLALISEKDPSLFSWITNFLRLRRGRRPVWALVIASTYYTWESSVLWMRKIYVKNPGSLINALSKSLCHMSDIVWGFSICQGSDGYDKVGAIEEVVSDISKGWGWCLAKPSLTYRCCCFWASLTDWCKSLLCMKCLHIVVSYFINHMCVLYYENTISQNNTI